ncbi:MAG: N-acetyltransferase [Chloroflexi bacterium]|nr:MAG: N-acetyltransferase [Chloroflexota bacterium]
MVAESFILETERLIVRPFVRDDLDDVCRVLDEAFGEEPRSVRQEWLEWAVRNYTALARLYQPPYGDRAIVLKRDQTVIGAVGLVPCIGPFDKLPYFRARSSVPPTGLFTTEMGLFWALRRDYRGQGYATESARALIDFAFERLALRRIVATTEHGNASSIAVMTRLGMTVERNPDPTPEWFQAVGILDNPAVQKGS